MSLADIVEQLKILNERHQSFAESISKQFHSLNNKIDTVNSHLQTLESSHTQLASKLNQTIDAIAMQQQAKQQLPIGSNSEAINSNNNNNNLSHQDNTKQDQSVAQQQQLHKQNVQQQQIQQDKDEDIITLNVGGTTFTTTRETLCMKVGAKRSQEHYFAAMINSCCPLQRDANGSILIDRDAKHFRYMLNYLRCGGNLEECALPVHSETLLHEIELEAKFYNLMELVDHITIICSNKARSFDVMSCTDNIEISNNQQTVKHNNTKWATVRSKQPLLLKISNAAMARQTNYFEIKIDKTENQNIMIGILNSSVDIKTAEHNWIGNIKDTYSFYCFDGRKYNSKVRHNAFGEECVAKDLVGVWVDVFEKKIYFFRNGRCMGVACEGLPLDQYENWYFAVSLCDKECAVTVQEAAKPPIILATTQQPPAAAASN